MFYLLIGLGLALLLFGGMIAFLELGRRLGTRALAKSPNAVPAGTGPLEAAVFGTLGLLIAFSFGGAVSRFEARRDLIVQEANALGTLWLRLDLLPTEKQGPVRELVRRYLDARLEAYARLPDLDAAQAGLVRAREVQSELWTTTVETLKGMGGAAPTPSILIPLNEVIDLATTRTEAARRHQHPLVFAMLFAMAFGAALMAGYGMARGNDRGWFHRLAFAGVTAAAVYVTMDFEFPRLGWIRVDAADQVLVELRASMK